MPTVSEVLEAHEARRRRSVRGCTTRLMYVPYEHCKTVRVITEALGGTQ
jgi:hypothetical protein